MLYDFAVVGGDRRLFYLAKFLKNKNFKVVSFGLADFKNEVCEIEVANSLKKALSNSKNWVLPIPVSRDGVFLNFVDEEGGLCGKASVSDCLSLVNKDIGVFGGAFSTDFFSALKNRTNFVYDFLKNESFAIFNSSLTAQAAIAQIVLKSPIDFMASTCLILGFGRCGKLLALKLKNFCFKVVVCMRNETEMAWANALGFEVIKLSDLKSKKNLNLRRFNFIFNTIPKKILSGAILKNLKKEVLVFDITSNGIDRKEFKKRSINAFVSLQIPGKFKFEASATYLANLIVKVLKDKSINLDLEQEG